MGSGASAFSLGFAAGLAATGGFGATTVPAFAIGGAGVLPSTGSAIMPLLYLLESNMSRTDGSADFYVTASYISATPCLSRRIPYFVRFCFRGLPAILHHQAGASANSIWRKLFPTVRVHQIFETRRLARNRNRAQRAPRIGLRAAFRARRNGILVWSETILFAESFLENRFKTLQSSKTERQA